MQKYIELYRPTTKTQNLIKQFILILIKVNNKVAF